MRHVPTPRQTSVRLQPGDWTDDTSMALCLAESLLECDEFDVRWWKKGHQSSNGRCFDIGGTTRGASARFFETRDPCSRPTQQRDGMDMQRGLTTMRAMDEQRTEMMQIATGYWLSKAMYCAAKTDVADSLAEGPRPVTELAAKAGVDEENLHRVLRALASVGIFAETEPGVFMLTDKAAYLRADHPGSMKHFALMVGDDLFEVWCDLYHAVETGQSAVEKRFGRDFFAEVAQNLQKSQLFDRAMEEIHGGETALMLEAYDFSRFETILDVGGGNGSTLCGLLRAHPGLRGQLFDLPAVAENARRYIAEAGMSDRIEVFAGDFFKMVEGNADGVLLRHVLHDWSDEDSKTILGNCRAALADGGRLLIAEKVITPGNDPSFAKLLDLNMMAIGGKERTEAQYRELLEATGFEMRAIHETPGPIDIVEGA
jgi:predicted O-methyltransferase YrrM